MATMTAEERGRRGFAAAAARHGKGAIIAIIRRRQAEGRRGYAVRSKKQAIRDNWDSIEAKARDIYGKWY